MRPTVNYTGNDHTEVYVNKSTSKVSVEKVNLQGAFVYSVQSDQKHKQGLINFSAEIDDTYILKHISIVDANF